jgi:accessory colonization factor AcfC
MKTIFLILLFGLIGSGCVTSPNLVKKRYASYGISPPSEDWHQESFRDADLFFKHKERNATIFFSTQCEKFSDSPLEALTAQILVGLSDIEIKKQERLVLAERDAMITELTAKVDGVTRFLKIMVLRKNRCVFDGVFSSALKSSDLAVDFDNMIAQFWAEAEL